MVKVPIKKPKKTFQEALQQAKNNVPNNPIKDKKIRKSVPQMGIRG